MHMPYPPEAPPIDENDPTILAQILWDRLHPEQWPLNPKQLPVGSALVGGAIRDGLLSKLKKQPDLDLVIPEEALGLCQNLAKTLGGKCVVLDAERNMARLVLHGWTIDFASQEGHSLEEDLWRRDFRLNAIALTLEKQPQLIDPTGGLGDLKKLQLVAVREQNLLDDPLRLLRGLRLMAELGLTIEKQTLSWIHLHHQRLPQAAPERIQAELLRLVHAPWADDLLLLVESTGLIKFWQPDLNTATKPPAFPDQAKALNPEEQALALPLARLTHLLSDDGLNQLRFSRKQRQRCQRLRQWHQRNDGNAFASLSETDRLQLHQDLEADLPALILQLPAADQRQWLERWRNPEDPLFHPSAPVNGNTLKESLGMTPGKELGNLLQHLCHERAFGRLNNEHEALQLARYWLNQKQTSL